MAVSFVWRGVILREFLTFFALQGLNFIVVVVNVRAIATERYLWVALTDGLFCAITWTLVKKIAEAESFTAKVGYVLGGVTGSLLAIWLTKEWT